MNVPEIDLDEAKQKLDEQNARFVDVRDPASFEEAHIPGATHLNDDSLEQFLAETPRDETVIVYCYHGNSSKGAVGFLLRQEFTQVFSMSGGFEEWRVRFGEGEGRDGA